MQEHSWRLNQVIAVTIAIACVMGLSTLALAQREDVHAVFATAPRVQTSVHGVTTFAAPPKDFNPLSATNRELLTYGLPQRPDKASDPKAYAIWERGMLALKTRPSDVKATPYSSHTMVPVGEPTAGDNNTVAYGSLNWSGIVNTNKLKAWSTTLSFNEVHSVFNVPVAKPPFGSVPCKDGPWLESSWNGIGGFTSAEGSLVQGGSSLYWDAGSCKGAIQYFGWVEWVPSYAELELVCGKNPCPVSSGDDFWVITYARKGDRRAICVCRRPYPTVGRYVWNDLGYRAGRDWNKCGIHCGAALLQWQPFLSSDQLRRRLLWRQLCVRRERHVVLSRLNGRYHRYCHDVCG